MHKIKIKAARAFAIYFSVNVWNPVYTHLSPCLPPLLGLTNTRRGWVFGTGLIYWMVIHNKRSILFNKTVQNDFTPNVKLHVFTNWQSLHWAGLYLKHLPIGGSIELTVVCWACAAVLYIVWSLLQKAKQRHRVNKLEKLYCLWGQNIQYIQYMHSICRWEGRYECLRTTRSSLGHTCASDVPERIYLDNWIYGPRRQDMISEQPTGALCWLLVCTLIMTLLDRKSNTVMMMVMITRCKIVILKDFCISGQFTEKRDS